MKQSILSFLALWLVAMGAMATTQDVVIYKVATTSGGGQTLAANTSVSTSASQATSGVADAYLSCSGLLAASATFTNPTSSDVSNYVASSNRIGFYSNDIYLALQLQSGETFRNGDVITYTTGTNDRTLCFTSTTTRSTTNAGGPTTGTDHSYTITDGDGLNGCNVIYVWRGTSTNNLISNGITVTRTYNVPETDKSKDFLIQFEGQVGSKQGTFGSETWGSNKNKSWTYDSYTITTPTEPGNFSLGYWTLNDNTRQYYFKTTNATLEITGGSSKKITAVEFIGSSQGSSSTVVANGKVITPVQNTFNNTDGNEQSVLFTALEPTFGNTLSFTCNNEGHYYIKVYGEEQLPANCVKTAANTYTINLTDDTTNGTALKELMAFVNAKGTAQRVDLKNGTYDLGTTYETSIGSNITLIGESRDGVIIINHPTGSGISKTATLKCFNGTSGQYLMNFTAQVDNSFAPALDIESNKAIICNVKAIGQQDCILTKAGNDANTIYFKDCIIQGTTDYICGYGNVWLENCEFNNAAESAYVFAPDTHTGNAFGYVANNCKVTLADGLTGNSWLLARSWGNEPRLNTINLSCQTAGADYGYGTTGTISSKALHFHEYFTHTTDGTEITSHELSKSTSNVDGSDAIYGYDMSGITYADFCALQSGWDPETIIASMGYEEPAAETMTVTTNDKGYASFSALKAVSFPENVTAYYSTGLNEKGALALTAYTDNKVPAGQGAFIKGEANTTYTATAVKEASYLTGNKIKPIYDTTNGHTVLSNETAYALATVNNEAGLYKVATGVAIKSKAYVSLDPSGQAKQSLVFSFDGETTAIESVNSEQLTVNNGKYIKDGRIVIVKDGKKFNVNGQEIR